MSPEVIPLEITVSRDFIKDVLRALLHTILFHRVFANIRPRDIDVLDMTIAAVEDPEMDHVIEEQIKAFARKLENGNIEKGPAFGAVSTIGSAQSSKGQIAVMFYERRSKAGWFSKTEEEVCWEQWAITITSVAPATDEDRQRLRNLTLKNLQNRLQLILRFASDHKNHIPPILVSDGNPFPYQIAIPTQTESWSSVLRRIVTDVGGGGGTVGMVGAVQ